MAHCLGIGLYQAIVGNFIAFRRSLDVDFTHAANIKKLIKKTTFFAPRLPYLQLNPHLVVVKSPSEVV